MPPGGDLEKGDANASLLQPRGGSIFLRPQNKGFDPHVADGVYHPKERTLGPSYPFEGVKIEDSDRHRSTPCTDKIPQVRPPSLPT